MYVSCVYHSGLIHHWYGGESTYIPRLIRPTTVTIWVLAQRLQA